jgi:hypothetical protein
MVVDDEDGGSHANRLPAFGVVKQPASTTIGGSAFNGWATGDDITYNTAYRELGQYEVGADGRV